MELVYTFNERSTGSVSKGDQPLKCYSNFLGGHIHIFYKHAVNPIMLEVPLFWRD